MKLALLLLAITFNVLAVDKDLVDRACAAYEFDDCPLIHAIVWTESSYKSPKVMDTNNRYSYGPMQIQCETARDVGLKFGCDQLSDKPLIGIRFGIRYVQKHLDRYGNVEDAIAAYNAGRVYKCRSIRTVKGRVACYTGEYVNYTYVNKVMRRYRYLTRPANVEVSML